MIPTNEIQVGDYFRLDDNTIIRIVKKLSVDYYDCSDDDIHTNDELLPIGSEYLDSVSNPKLENQFLHASASPTNKDGTHTLFQNPAHIVQNHMRENYGVEYEIDKGLLTENTFNLSI